MKIITLHDNFKKHLKIDLSKNEDLIFDREFISNLSLDTAIKLSKRARDNREFNLSVLIDAIENRPVDLANSKFLDNICEQFDILKNIGIERLRNALNSGKEKSVLDYLYNKLPKKVLKENVEFYAENEEVKSFFNNIYSHFVIPTSKNIKNFSHALNVCEDLHFYLNRFKETDEGNQKNTDIKDLLISGVAYDYIYKYDLFPQIEEGYIHKAKMAKIIFDEGLYSIWQDYFKIQGNKIIPWHNDDKFNEALEEVFELKSLSPDQKIKFYVMMINDSERYECTCVEYDYSKEILEIVKECDDDWSKKMVWQIVSGQINYFLNENKPQEALSLTSNEIYQKLSLKFSPDVDTGFLFNSQNMEAIRLFFRDKTLEDSCIREFKNDEIAEEIKILMEKHRLSIELDGF